MADLHFGDDEPTAAERAAVLSVVPEAGVLVESERVVRAGTRRRRERRHLLLPALHALQREAGWISPGGANCLGRRLQVPPAEVYGVATFYDLLRTERPSHDESTHHVCVDPVCAVAGAAECAAVLRAEGRHVHEGPCLGQCERAPGVFVQGLREPDRVPDRGPADAHEPLPQHGDPSLRLLRRIGHADPADLDSYRSHGGYEALALALDLGADEVLDRVAASGLSGRGGAAFPTGVKWRAVAERDRTRPAHVVANADESEPGTFKDRIVIERDPFALVEAMTIAAVTVGAERGWVYIRGEYPLATQRLADAVDQARAAGLLGPDLAAAGPAGAGVAFDIEIRRGAGAYICGEETALFNSLEGFRGEPRNKPPFPTTHGLFGEPTVVNNPETLLNVLDVLTMGVDAYRAVGTEASPGTKLFCLSGRVARPGLYEMPFGTTLGELLELAGGVEGTLRAILLGGAAGSFVPPDSLDLPLTLEDARAAGATLGSGPVMVFDDSVDMHAVVVRLARFFADESCGQCVPCRVGTQRQHEVLVRIGRGPGETVNEADRGLLDDIARAMGDASICGLGHTAASAVQSAVALGLLDTPAGAPS